jgi:hypothetical protein
MRPERQPCVVGARALGAQPAALEERRRDVPAVADDVDRERVRVRAQRRREDEARLGRLLDAT